jgi:hypothetical protein
MSDTETALGLLSAALDEKIDVKKLAESTFDSFTILEPWYLLETSCAG